jgi:4-aminobutyrate aminotransferase-like enzyme
MKLKISDRQRLAWEKAARYLLPSLVPQEPGYQLQLVAERGEGHYLIDLDGNRILDFNMLKNPLGHAPKYLTERLTEQAGKLWDTVDLLSVLMGQMAERLVRRLPKGIDVISLYSSGSEAMEAALAIARGAVSPRRKKIMAMEGNYHGWTLGSLLATAHVAGRRTHPAWLSTVLIPFPQNPDSLPGDPVVDDGSPTLAHIEQALVNDKSIGIFVAEPVQMDAGVRTTPPGFWTRLVDILRRHDVLIISDEVSTGGWRNGNLLAAPEIQPDIVLFSKSIGAGLGSCVMAARRETIKRTRAQVPVRNNLLSAAIADAVLDEVERLQLPDQIPHMATRMADAMRVQRERHLWIRHARAMGLLGGLDLFGEGVSFEEAERRTSTLAGASLERGLRLSYLGSHILLLPALIVDSPCLEKAFEILDETLQDLESGRV